MQSLRISGLGSPNAQDFVLESQGHWSRYYATAATQPPSAFAQFLLQTLKRDAPLSIIDLGCGNLRDSNYFASAGYPVLAIDQVDTSEFIDPAYRKLLQFKQENILDQELLVKINDYIKNNNTIEILAYARFVLHSIPEEACYNLIAALASVDAIKSFAFEFRITEDRYQPHIYDDHRRYYVKMDALTTWCEHLGLRVVHTSAGKGLALYNGEDPIVGRLLLRR